MLGGVLRPQNTKIQVLNVKFHMGEDPQQMPCDTGTSQKCCSNTNPQHIYLPQWSKHTEHPESFMDWSDQLTTK